MTSLAEAYGDSSPGPGYRRRSLGTALLAAGTLLSVCALLLATTGVLRGLGVGLYQARHLAGLLGGLGVPAALLGVFTVLPTSRYIKGVAVIGASVCVLGVSLFWWAYPTYWVGSTAAQDYTLLVAGVYALGLLTATWCLFTAVVNFKTRNDPGGTVTMEVTRDGETRVVTVPRERAPDGTGGVGLLGDRPDGDVATQTNRSDTDPTPATDGAGTLGAGAGTDGAGATTGADGTRAASDGGAVRRDPPSDAGPGDAEVLGAEPAPHREPVDIYCGNCEHFKYVRTDDGMQPYCALSEAVMEDMDACEEWAPHRATRSP